nr:unnamed protein product [Callosobruchus chinensis]
MLENLIHWNINGIKSKYCDLKSLITSYGPFCLALQETHLRPSDTFTLRGYKTFRKDAVSYDRACGGVITLIRDSIPASEVTLNTSLQSTAVKIHYPVTLGVRLKETQECFQITFPGVYPLSPSESPPWINRPLELIKLRGFDKKETYPTIIRNTWNTFLEKYRDWAIIYTDGSKMDGGCGCAIVHNDTSYTWTLPVSSTIFTAELYAIWHALQYIDIKCMNNVIVCTDSLSSVDALKQLYPRDPLIQKIQAKITHLRSQSFKFIFVWVPSHVGITGNELADNAAKLATTQQVDENILVRPDDVKTSFKPRLKIQWQNEWNNTTAKLKQLKPEIGKTIYPSQMTRREQSVCTRLRIGHTRLTSSYLFTREEPPVCFICDLQLTVQHIIAECPAYEAERWLYQISDDLIETLNTSPRRTKALLLWLQSTGLFNKI